MHQKYTLIVDGNYFMRRLHGGAQISFLENPKDDEREMLKGLSQSFASLIRTHKDYINNVVMVRDFSSWRKKVEQILPLECQSEKVEEDTYKANRVEDASTDWSAVYACFDKFCDMISGPKFKVPIIKAYGAEGDDSIYVVGRLLSNNGIKCLIWSIDGDFAQSVNENILFYRKTKKTYLYVSKSVMEAESKPKSIFDNPYKADYSQIVNNTDGGLWSVNPAHTVLDKILRGDAKDNVAPLIAWKAGSRNARLSNKHVEKALADVGKTKDTITFDDLYDEDFVKLLVGQLISHSKQDRSIEHSIKVFESNRKMLHLSDKAIPKEIIDGVIAECRVQLIKKPQLSLLKSYSNIFDQFGVNEKGSYFDQIMDDSEIIITEPEVEHESNDDSLLSEFTNM